MRAVAATHVKGVRRMAAMPEIIGEVDREPPEPVEMDRVPPVRGDLLPSESRRLREMSTETPLSPIMMRLLDFAGEGERAPPGMVLGG